MTKGKRFSAPSVSRRWKTGRRDRRGIAGIAGPVLVTSVRRTSRATKLIISYPATRTEEFMSEAAGTSPIRLSQELTIFHDVAKALTSSLNLDSILQTIMEKMAEYFRPDTWSLLMVDEEKDELYFAIAVGTASETLKNVRLKVGEGIAGWVAKHGERLIVPDVYTDPRFAKRIDEMTRLQSDS